MRKLIWAFLSIVLSLVAAGQAAKELGSSKRKDSSINQLPYDEREAFCMWECMERMEDIGHCYAGDTSPKIAPLLMKGEIMGGEELFPPQHQVSWNMLCGFLPH